jgi:hypothetical protein
MVAVDFALYRALLVQFDNVQCLSPRSLRKLSVKYRQMAAAEIALLPQS